LIEWNPLFLGHRSLQRVEHLARDRQTGRIVVRPHHRGIHANQFQADRPRDAASAISPSINASNTPAFAQMRKRPYTVLHDP
jgi:hypothetical protein